MFLDIVAEYLSGCTKADVHEACRIIQARWMAKLKQTFRNPTNTPLFVNLELSTSRFRLRPGETLILSYDSADLPADEHGAALGIEVIQGI